MLLLQLAVNIVVTVYLYAGYSDLLEVVFIIVQMFPQSSKPEFGHGKLISGVDVIYWTYKLDNFLICNLSFYFFLSITYFVPVKQHAF